MLLSYIYEVYPKKFMLQLCEQPAKIVWKTQPTKRENLENAELCIHLLILLLLIVEYH